MLSDDELLRYSRQIMLPGWDIAAQEKLKAAKALIIGLGGLGCPVALYLAAAGVGELYLADFDTVDTTNLQRQILHHTVDVGQLKVASAAAKLRALNPLIAVHELPHMLDADSLRTLVEQMDVVLDCTDNFVTRDAVNAACVAAGKPLVSGAAIGMSGQLAVFDLRQQDSPCYRCLYPDIDEAALGCAESGVLATVVGVVGTLQAHEALKVLAGVGHTLAARLWLWDGETMEMRTLRLKKDAACAVCKDRYVRSGE
jgi:adenylyltransferase/sulfurtransferase